MRQRQILNFTPCIIMKIKTDLILTFFFYYLKGQFCFTIVQAVPGSSSAVSTNAACTHARPRASWRVAAPLTRPTATSVVPAVWPGVFRPTWTRTVSMSRASDSVLHSAQGLCEEHLCSCTAFDLASYIRIKALLHFSCVHFSCVLF